MHTNCMNLISVQSLVITMFNISVAQPVILYVHKIYYVPIRTYQPINKKHLMN